VVTGTLAATWRTQRWYLSDNHTLALNAPTDRSGGDEYMII
jgi:hypothetical protein